MARIFICSDPAMASLLGTVATALEHRGHVVVIGPTDRLGLTDDLDAAAGLLDDADLAIFTNRHRCSRGLMAAASRLRGIVYPAIGVETLDLAAANELGLIVGHGAVRGNVVGMAEATIMLMLMLLYDVETNIALLGAGKWRRPGHHSRQLEGRTIGLVGFGRIARAMAERLAPFGVVIVTASPRTPQVDLPPGVTKVDLDTLLRDSDVVSVLAGLTPETRHLIDARGLALMKPTAYLVNTARGAVIDEAALIDALRARRIAGAALDTFETEPLSADSPLRSLDTVILTPHCAGHTIDSHEQLEAAMLANVSRILDGVLPLHCKNPEAEPAWRERLRRLAASEGRAA